MTQVHEASDFLGVVTMGVQVLDLIRSAQFFYWAHRSRFYPVGNAAQQSHQPAESLADQTWFCGYTDAQVSRKRFDQINRKSDELDREKISIFVSVGYCPDPTHTGFGNSLAQRFEIGFGETFR